MADRRNWKGSNIWALRGISTALMGVALVGCSSMERAVMFGVASGAVVGTSAGLMVGGDDQTESALIGLGIGAVVGAIASYAIQGGIDKHDDETRRETLFNLENHGIKSSLGGKANSSDIDSLLTVPDVEENWIETHVDGKKLIEGHKVWTILDSTNWDLTKKTEKKKHK